MGNRSSLLIWLKEKMDRITKEEDADNVQIESYLVRAVSDYREKELLDLLRDKDLNQKLMDRLDHIESEDVEMYCSEKTTTFSRPLVFTFGLAIVAIIAFMMIDFGESHNIQIPAQTNPVEAKTLSKNSSGENSLMNELKRNPENIRILEKLEIYYNESGKKEHATEIHSVLEAVIKKD